jgi:hypothetical protein
VLDPLRSEHEAELDRDGPRMMRVDRSPDFSPGVA